MWGGWNHPSSSTWTRLPGASSNIRFMKQNIKECASLGDDILMKTMLHQSQGSSILSQNYSQFSQPPKDTDVETTLPTHKKTVDKPHNDPLSPMTGPSTRQSNFFLKSSRQKPICLHFRLRRGRRTERVNIHITRNQHGNWGIKRSTRSRQAFGV